MFHNIDLEALAQLNGPDRAFLSLYLHSPGSIGTLNNKIARVRELLDEGTDEAQHFEENLGQLEEFLDNYEYESGSLAIFACWALEYFEAYRVDEELPDLLWVDSSPYIRPLAELQDRFETFVVVLADNTETRIFLVASAKPQEQEKVKGDIKNHVRKGGWSQQRYARRRRNELGHYAKEVIKVLEDLAERKEFDKILLLGSDEAMRAISEEMPQALTGKLVGSEPVDLHQDDETWESAFEMYFEEDRKEDHDLWEEIKAESLREGRAALGPEDVLKAASVGRVERMLVTQDARIAGKRCRECENLLPDSEGECPVCGADELFTVDLVNELIELLMTSDAEAEWTEPIDGLSRAGDVAALLRY